MQSNQWGGSLEINAEEVEEQGRGRDSWDRSSLSFQRMASGMRNVDAGMTADGAYHSGNLEEMQQSWLLGPPEMKKGKYIDLGCIMCSRKLLKLVVWSFIILSLTISVPIIIAKTFPKHHNRAPVSDNYTLALNKALLFFDAQKSGRLPKNKKVPWRRDSGLRDGAGLPGLKGSLVGGYYDAGDNTKFHFPMAFAMTMLSWSVVEYAHKYRAGGEYEHVRELIKWGTDYLLLTFNSTATKIDEIHSQVGGGLNGSATPNDFYCWQRPEDMDYPRPVQTTTTGPDLAGEMAAALAAASIVFRDDVVYSKKLVKGANALFSFARDFGRRTPYSRGIAYTEPHYNSTGYFDEYIWGAAWLYYATGNRTYLSLATSSGIAKNAGASRITPQKIVFSWDNKLPGAMLLLTRMRIFLSPGFPYEDMLSSYHNLTGLTMCSYLKQFRYFNWTRGGLIRLTNRELGPPLQYVANAAFLASLFVDYMDASGVPGWYCGSQFVTSDVLRSFATSQVDYILGANPVKLSYVVGYGKFPTRVHHRAASIPQRKKATCTGGWKWRDSKRPNPHNITGAMVGGPDRFDRFRDVRANRVQTEPSLAGNAGLVTALVSLTSVGGSGIDKNTIFSAVPPLYPPGSPPPSPWKP